MSQNLENAQNIAFQKQNILRDIKAELKALENQYKNTIMYI